MPVIPESVWIQLIVTSGGLALAWINLKAGQRKQLDAIVAGHAETTASLKENTEKTEAVGHAVNGRVEELAEQKAALKLKPLNDEIERLKGIIADLQASVPTANPFAIKVK